MKLKKGRTFPSAPFLNKPFKPLIDYDIISDLPFFK